jgi:hypothetical protein
MTSEKCVLIVLIVLIVWLNLVHVFRNLGTRLNLGKIIVFLRNMYQNLRLGCFTLQPLYILYATKT